MTDVILNLQNISILNRNKIQTQKLSDLRRESEIKTYNGTAGEADKLKEVCSDFQALFIKQMLDSMRKTVQKGGIIKENQAEQIFEDMLYDEYSKNISNTAGFGLDTMMYKQLNGQYEAALAYAKSIE